MLLELRAVEARIKALGVNAYIGQVPAKVEPPYAPISAPGMDLGEEPTLVYDGTIDNGQVRVRVTDVTLANVLATLKKIRDDLSPDLGPSQLDVSGRRVEIVWLRAEGAPIVDRDATYEPTNRHLVTGVETYRIVSQPA